jgi:hypothetical protein
MTDQESARLKSEKVAVACPLVEDCAPLL